MVEVEVEVVAYTSLSFSSPLSSPLLFLSTLFPSPPSAPLCSPPSQVLCSDLTGDPKSGVVQGFLGRGADRVEQLWAQGSDSVQWVMRYRSVTSCDMWCMCVTTGRCGTYYVRTYIRMYA